MAHKLRTRPGRKAYSRRKAIVEPVFGQIMTCQNGRKLLLRGEDGARGEWRLLAACHNLRKILRQAGTTGGDAPAGRPGRAPRPRHDPRPPDTRSADPCQSPAQARPGQPQPIRRSRERGRLLVTDPRS
ncbi:hypothetical protein GCM10023235_15010 [Kitasatospora terrestris]|uniref:Transposase DDE domain-containing protein n=1 Tax=Kitasatospora terrestris TaxID=258051 RepID=A0ABP9DFE7_9ACTN